MELVSPHKDSRRELPHLQESATLESDAPDSIGYRNTIEKIMAHGREAEVALYSYPRVQDGVPFWMPAPESTREDKKRTRRDLEEMEEQLQNVTKQRISEVSETL